MGFPRQRSFATTPLHYNSTISLQSVQLNTDFVDDRLTGSLAVSALPELDRTDTVDSKSCRHREKSECTDGTITPPLTHWLNSLKSPLDCQLLLAVFICAAGCLLFCYWLLFIATGAHHVTSWHIVMYKLTVICRRDITCKCIQCVFVSFIYCTS